MSVVVLAWGNDARGDDGIGPALATHIARRWPSAALVVDDQLQLEHALELRERTLALFIDAGRNMQNAYNFYEIAPRGGLAHTSHALSPESVLDVARRIGVPVPAAFVLCVAGESWELGQSLSNAAKAHVEIASKFVDRLLARPEAGRWRRQIEPASA